MTSSRASQKHIWAAVLFAVALLSALLIPIIPSQAQAQEGSSPMILNEWNAVDKELFLKNGGTDSTLGIVLGNGGDWFELVVIEDNLDLRGWMLEISDKNNELEIQEITDTFVFADQPLLASLRAGTIITVSEDFADDVSYDPAGGDWNINFQANSDDEGAYFTADSQSNFGVNNEDWQLVIRDAAGVAVFGPAGEGVGGASGISDEEIGELEADPSAAITAASGYDDGNNSTYGEPNEFEERAQDFSLIRPALGDTEDPDTTIDEPAPREILRDTVVTVTGTATDNVGIDEVQVALRNKDTGEWLRSDGTFGGFEFLPAVIDVQDALSTGWTFTSVLPEGKWIVVARANDLAGNWDSSRPRVAFEIDTSPADVEEPETTIDSPGAGEVLGDGAVVVTGTATDNVGVDEVEVALRNKDTGQWLRSDGTLGSFEFLAATIDSQDALSTGWTFEAELPEGKWVVVARANDLARNWDSTRPRVSFEIAVPVAVG